MRPPVSSRPESSDIEAAFQIVKSELFGADVFISRGGRRAGFLKPPTGRSQNQSLSLSCSSAEFDTFVLSAASNDRVIA